MKVGEQGRKHGGFSAISSGGGSKVLDAGMQGRSCCRFALCSNTTCGAHSRADIGVVDVAVDGVGHGVTIDTPAQLVRSPADYLWRGKQHQNQSQRRIMSRIR